MKGVEFRIDRLGGLEVLVNGHKFGHITQRYGFNTGPTRINGYIQATPRDLRIIASKTEEVLQSETISVTIPDI